MSTAPVKKRADNKVKVFSKLQAFLTKYSSILICDIKDMPANNIHKMRKQLRDIDSEVLCGKTTVMAVAINEFAKGKLPSHCTKESLQ